MTHVHGLRLPADEAHVCYVLTAQLADRDRIDRWQPLMSAEERARHARFVFQKDRDLFLISRALVRMLLSHYFGGDPAAWSFRTNRYGRPSLQNGPRGMLLDFNLAHAHGIVACALTLNRNIGVDVEEVRRAPIEDGLYRHYFSPSEVAAIEALPEEQRRLRFFEYWTLKEAYLKAIGRGLSLPLDAFSIWLEPAGRARISFTPAIVDDPAVWQLAQFRVGGDALIALAVRRRGPNIAIRLRDAAAVLG